MLADLRYALRTLLRSPGFTFVAVLVLALGIGANTAVFSVINAVLLKPLPYPQPGRLVSIREKMQLFDYGSVSLPNYLDWREANKSFTDLAITNRSYYSVTSAPGENTAPPENINAVDSSYNLLSILGMAPELGRDITPAEDVPGGPKVVLIGDALWRRRFGADPHIIGRHVLIDAVDREIIGVVPSDFTIGRDRPEAIVPLGDVRKEVWALNRDNHPGFSVVGRLRDGVTFDSARADMDGIAAELERRYPASNTGRRVNLRGLLEASTSQYRQGLYVLLGAVACVLLIACANVANLQLARATGRSRELAVRAALGASRWRLVRQTLVESALLGALGGAAGLLVAMWSIDAIAALRPGDHFRFDNLRLDWTALCFALAAALATGLLVGVWPAWRLSRAATMATALQEGNARGASGGRSRVRARSLLVVAQVALALVLLVGAGLALRTFWRLRNQSLGFDPHGILMISLSLPEKKYGQEGIAPFYDTLIERVHALPGVVAAATGVNVPFDDNEWDSGIHIVGTPPYKPGENPSAEFNFATPEYFQVMGMPILRGRGIERRDVLGQEKVAVVDESFVQKFFPNSDPLGQHFDDTQTLDKEPPPVTIVGVVARTRNDGVAESVYLDKMTQVTRSVAQSKNVYSRWLLVRVADGDPLRLVEPIRQIVLGLDPGLPFAQVSTMERNVAASLAPQRLTMVLLGAFAAVALGLATVGLYGVMALSVTQRTRELGIRLALGAQRGDVLRLVLRQGALLVGIGLAIGVVVALGMGRVLDHYGVGGNDALTLAIVCVVLAGAALLACWLPARRATRLNPMVALRAE